MDAAKWPQNFPEVGLVKQPMPMKEVVSNTCNTSTSTRAMLERKARAQEQLNCPRCNSTNTKFCYYNNYSLTQPRYFCKACRRYWTEGGSLRNVPVGGGSRKNKRSISSSSSSSPSPSSNIKLLDLNPPSLQNPKIHRGQDLNLHFQVMHNETHGMSHFIEAVSKAETNNITNMSPVLALDLLRTGIASRDLDSFIPTVPIPDSNSLFSSGFPLQDIKPGTLSFSIDHMHHGVVQENNGTENGRLFFPFGDQLKQLSSTPSTEVDQNKGEGTSNGYWNGMFGGGPW